MRILFFVVLLGACLFSLFLGPVKTSPSHLNKETFFILWNFRLPRVVFAAVNGAMLGLSGSLYQLVLRNPLADGFTTGTASASALGAVVAISLGFPAFLVPFPALLGGLLGLVFVYRLSSRSGVVSPVTMVLAGIVVNIVSSSGISFLKYLFEESLSSVVFWLMGGFFLVDWSKIGVCLTVLLAILAYSLFDALSFNLLALDRYSAASSGVDVDGLRRRLFLLATALVALSVSFTGIIGFVGLIVPHVARALFGSDMRENVYYSTLMGAMLLVVADALSRVVVPQGAELPVGIITSLAGGSFFLWLLFKKREGLWYAEG
ncbi:MAG TPA: iron ABC transporter permease [Thermosulfidibacter takaii]|uniref:Iron ABC transporter permease n=1 Tax=Thermosulfidibacter takaii TaxID=412593 RepID=A0A7C0U607_9BACT|nr:iron ABC transporter permease [Thermosulfidibacter takaii]